MKQFLVVFRLNGGFANVVVEADADKRWHDLIAFHAWTRINVADYLKSLSTAGDSLSNVRPEDIMVLNVIRQDAILHPEDLI